MFEEYEKLSNPKKQMFSDICNELLAYNFLVRTKKDNMEKYYFVINYKQIFDEYFKIIGYELFIDHETGALQIINNNNGNRLKLKKEESIVLLILRLLYHKKMGEVSLNELITVSVHEVIDYYQNLKLKKYITKTELTNILRLFKRYNLIDVLGDASQGNTRIVIYPSILLVLSTKNIQDVVNLLGDLTEEGDNDEEIS